MKKQISGIYAIINKVNGKRYIGSSKSAQYRWNQSHRPNLRNNTHNNRHLQSAWNKYGEENFKHVIIEECDQSILLEREGYWIEYHKSWERLHGYNLSRIVDGKQILSEETKTKISEAKAIDNYWTTGTNGEILKLFRQGKSKSDIAKKLKVSRCAVYSCLEKNGLHKNTGEGSVIKLTDEVRQQVTDLRDKGKTWTEIIEEVPVSETQLRRANAIKADGKYQSKKVNRETYRTVTDRVAEQALKLRKQGKTWEEIEVKLGVSRFALHQNGITNKSKPISPKGRKKKKANKDQIVALKSKGMSVKEISKITGLSQSTVRYNLK